MKYSLRTLLILAAVGPPLLALVVATVAWALTQPLPPATSTPPAYFPRSKPFPDPNYQTLEYYPTTTD